jgi:malic enzyme
MLLDGAKALAGQVLVSDLEQGSVYPELARIRECSKAVACAVIRRAVEEGYADALQLVGLEDAVANAMWQPAYRAFAYDSACAGGCSEAH